MTRRMRAADRAGRTVTIRLRFDDFTRATRSHTLDRATAHTPTILAVARDLLAIAGPLIMYRGCTLVGVAVSNLDDHGHVQLTLPFAAHERGRTRHRGRRRSRAIRVGRALTCAVLLGRDPGLTVPMLPD